MIRLLLGSSPSATSSRGWSGKSHARSCDDDPDAADREVRRALAAGAALIMVPVVIKVGRPKKKRRRYSLEQLLARLIGDWRCACF